MNFAQIHAAEFDSIVQSLADFTGKVGFAAWEFGHRLEEGTPTPPVITESLANMRAIAWELLEKAVAAQEEMRAQADRNGEFEQFEYDNSDEYPYASGTYMATFGDDGFTTALPIGTYLQREVEWAKRESDSANKQRRAAERVCDEVDIRLAEAEQALADYKAGKRG